jgi:hypothetical protein
MSTKKWKSPQAFVDTVVHNCIAQGMRDRDSIIALIQTERVHENNLAHAEGRESGIEGMNRTEEALRVRVSRPTSREDKDGHRDIWCLDKRYVSLRRFDDLTEARATGNIAAEEYVEFVQSREDLFAIADKKEAEANKLFAIAKQLREKARNADSPSLDLRDADREMV